MKTTLRDASNVYSPSVLSFLQVPLSSSSSDQDILYIVEKDEATFRAMHMGMGTAGIKAACDLKKIDENFVPIIQRYLDGEISIEEATTYESIRKQEWNTLIQSYINEQNFISKQVDIHEELSSYFDAIYRVDSVPEVQVLKGFTRLDYLDRFEDKKMELQPVVSKSENWLPAVRNYSEGIFIKFNLAKLKQWEQSEPVTKAIYEAYGHYREE